jgi:hypothetical protein
VTIEDLARTQAAQVDRNSVAPKDAFTTRRATVTSISPFTILINGVSVVSPPKSPGYYPLVGDIVLVLMDGSAPYVLESVNRAPNGGLAYSRKTILIAGPSASGTVVDVPMVSSALVSPVTVTGWIEVTANMWLFSTVTCRIAFKIYDNATSNSEFGGGFGLTGAVQTAFMNVGDGNGLSFANFVVGTWMPAAPVMFSYQTVAGRSHAPTLRISSDAATQVYWTGITTVKIYSD